MKKICKVDNCNNFAHSKGYCGKHLWRFIQHGDPLKTIINREHPLTCSIEGCNRSYKAKGLCKNHYAIRFNSKRWEYLKKLRLKAIEYYSKGKMCCVCCGEKILQFLLIDHMNNDGAKHRKIIGKNIYSWLNQNNYPDDFQILCWNCNEGKRVNNGVCPHKT